MKYLFRLALACACALTLCAQTKDYGRDFRGVTDANQSTRSRPFRVVTAAPSGSCTTHEWAWSTTASNLYYCPAGTWAVFPFATLTGAETLTNKTLTLPIIGAYTVSGLPAAATANRLAIITDALTAGSTTGGGAARTLVRDTGSAWEAIGDGGSGGGGASNFAGLTDLKVTRASNVYTIAAGSYFLNGVRYAQAAATVTLTGSTGNSTLHFWEDENGCNVGHIPGATLATSGCTERTGVSSFPLRGNIIQLATATYTLPSTFNDPTDPRSAFSRTEIEAGDTNTAVSYSGGKTQISASGAINYAGKTTVTNQTGLSASKPTTCAQGQTYMQTDGTTGLYVHIGAGGTCAWAKVGGGKAPLLVPIGNGGGASSAGSVYNSAAWVFSASSPPAYDITSATLPTTIAFDGTTTGSIHSTTQIPWDWDGGAIDFSALFYIGSPVGYGDVVMRAKAICADDGGSISGTSWGTTLSLTMAVSAGSNGDIRRAHGTIVPAGTCAAGGALKVSLDRDSSDSANVNTKLISAGLRYLANVQ